MEVVELRSDTFTKPTPAMRRAMAEAEVGDDVWGEDPTAIALEAQCADLFGTEAALFVPSGTMGNEAALKTLTHPGEEVIVEATSHIVLHERGAPGVISGVMLRTLESPSGALEPDAVKAVITAADGYSARPTLLWIENTHNQRGGRIVPIETIRALATVARAGGLRVFIDGARIFNASVASGIPVAEYAAEVDGLTFCFSKGLGAPIGSMVVGSSEFIAELRGTRQLLGGGMRQVGVICAAARVALETGIDRLAEDHDRARRLAEGLAAALPGSVDPALVETNMVFCEVGADRIGGIVDAMAADGIRVAAVGPATFRAVTHRDVTDDGIQRATASFGRAVDH